MERLDREPERSRWQEICAIAIKIVANSGKNELFLSSNAQFIVLTILLSQNCPHTRCSIIRKNTIKRSMIVGFYSSIK